MTGDAGSVTPDGWHQVGTEPDRYTGWYEADGQRMRGGAEKTDDGYRFCVRSPTETFWKNAHQFLADGRGLVEGAYFVHLPGEELPSTLAEGIERVEQWMTGEPVEGDA